MFHRLVLMACLLWMISTSASSDEVVVRRIEISGNTRTETRVIQREVLFVPGDTLSVSIIEETERNLRALLFLGDVSVRVEKQDGFADIHICVTDLYARAITPLLSGELDELSYGAVGLDYNFLGRGQIVEVTAEHDAVTGNRGRAFYREPRLGGSRVRLDLDGEIASEGHRALLRFARPFYQLSEYWSAGATAFSEASITRLYSGQTLAEKYTVNERGGSASVSRSFGDGFKIRPGFFVSLVDRRADPESGYAYAPNDRRRVLASAGLTLWRPRYEKVRFVRQLGRVEDMQTGSWADVRAGISAEAIGSDRDYRFMTVDLNPRFKPGQHAYLLTRFTLRSRFSEGRAWNVFGSAEGKLLAKVRNVHAVALRVRYDGLGRTEDATQYLLGPARGLRGYSLRRFDGSRRFLFNAEVRPTLVQKRDFTLAGALFVDGGSAWTPGKTNRVLAMSAGAGGRVGMNRVYNSPVLRADVAYGFEDRSWAVYVGLGQYF